MSGGISQEAARTLQLPCRLSVRAEDSKRPRVAPWGTSIEEETTEDRTQGLPAGETAVVGRPTPLRRASSRHCSQLTVIPDEELPSQAAWNGVVQPLRLAAAASLGQLVADAPVTVSQLTAPGLSTHTCVARSQVSWIPELPHTNVPVHGPDVSVRSHALEDDVVPHAAATAHSAANWAPRRTLDSLPMIASRAPRARRRVMRSGGRRVARCGSRSIASAPAPARRSTDP